MTPRPHGSEERDIFDARAEHMDEAVRAMMNRMGSTLPRSFLDGHYMMHELLLLVLDHPKTRLMVEAPVSPPGQATELTAPGDELQSAASRLAEYVRSLPYEDVPYEVSMAVLEAQSAVEDWTAARSVPAGEEPDV